MCSVELIFAGEAPSDKAALIAQRVDEFASGLATRALGHDVFHAQDCLSASALFAYGRGARGRIARTVHHVERFDDRYLATCQRRSILDADLVFSVSRITDREVREEFARPTALVHNGVDAARFASPKDPTRKLFRAKYGIDSDDTLILSVGGVEPRKNTRRCLAALARLHATCPPVAWVIVGGESIWDHREYRESFDRDLGALAAPLASRIIQTGAIPDEDLTGLYRESDVLLCPSLHEGFGLCVLEAMAAGTAVITAEREPFTEYLDSRSAVLVDPESVDGIAEALLGLTLDPRRRAALAASASKVATHFSWDRSAALHVPHYETMHLAATRARV